MHSSLEFMTCQHPWSGMHGMSATMQTLHILEEHMKRLATDKDMKFRCFSFPKSDVKRTFRLDKQKADRGVPAPIATSFLTLKSKAEL